MAIQALGRVGPQKRFDGDDTPPREGNEGQLIVSQLHGKHYESAMRGNMYIGNSAATGIALIVAATTGGHPTLWNPTGSGVNLSILKLELGYVSGNNAPGSLVWAITERAGAQQATAGAILTATKVAAQPAVFGGPSRSKAIWSPTTNTFTAAPAVARSTGLSLFTGVAATAVAPFPMIADYDGDFVIAPDTAVSLCSIQATTTSLLLVSVLWEEIPIV